MQYFLSDFLKMTQDPTMACVLAATALAPGDSLSLGGGELHLYPQGGFEKDYYISNNDAGKKAIAFPLLEKQNVTIDGGGARLIFHGKLLPFVIDRCDGVTIRNLTVDYAEPMYFEGRIVDAGDDFVEMEYDEAQFHLDLMGRKFRFYGENWENITEKVLVNEFDPTTRGPVPMTATYFACTAKERDGSFLSSLFRYLTPSKPAANRLRLEGELGFTHNIGKYWLCTHNSREFPGIFGTDSNNLRLENITLHHTLSMGVICQMCENISLSGVVAEPKPGRLLSVDADATHFVNCSGLIHMKNCRFESMMDDAANIHGIYLPLHERLDDHRVLLTFGHHQQQGIMIFKPGDRIRLVDNNTLSPREEFTVAKSTLLSGRYLLLETCEALPAIIPKGFVFENHSRMPRVHIESCISGYNRPRGFLLTTNRDVLVENCEFHNISHAIAINGDANSWFESGPAGRILLRGNRFENAAYSGGAVIASAQEIPVETGIPYHGELVLEGNHFRTNGKRFLDVHGMHRVVMHNNSFTQDDTLPPAGSIGETGCRIQGCDICEAEALRELP